MQRIDTVDAAAALPTPAASGTPGYFTGGNPATSTPATEISADWLNMVQEELAGVALADGGAALDKTNHGQVLANIRLLISAAITAAQRPAATVRQCILSSAVDSSGYPNFITAGSGLAVSIAATSTPVRITAANGYDGSGQIDRFGAITADTAISGLVNSTTNYLYADIASDGTCTLGSTTTAPVYQYGGSASSTSGHFTFDEDVMIGKVGNGSTAVQTYRVFLGHAVTAGGSVSSVTNYMLMSRFYNRFAFAANDTTYTIPHKLGYIPRDIRVLLACTTAEGNYAVGEQIPVTSSAESDGTTTRGLVLSVDSTNVYLRSSPNGIRLTDKVSGTLYPTPGNWDFVIRASGVK